MLRRSLGGLVLALMVIALSLMSPAPALAGPPGDSVVAIAQVTAPTDSALVLEQLAVVAPAVHVATLPPILNAHVPRAASARPAPATADSITAAPAPILGVGATRRSATARGTFMRHPTSLPATLAADSLFERRSPTTSFTALALLTVALRH